MGTISLQTLKPLLLKGTWEEKRVYNGPQECPRGDLGGSRRAHGGDEEGRPLREEESSRRECGSQGISALGAFRQSSHRISQQAVGSRGGSGGCAGSPRNGR